MMFGGMFLFWILLIVGAGWFFKNTVEQRQQNSSRQSEDALSILRNRYAKGEISKEEFDERKTALV
ncbi:MAG: SHOCT domain-containing protein [Calditrichaeota bacterium]|nr:SHOCT domain-containing protein [Calditrichota bacterium]